MTVGGNIPAEVSQNGLNTLTGLPLSHRTVSLSPDAAVKQADTTAVSQSNHAALATCNSLPVTPSHAGMLFDCHTGCFFYRA